MQRWKTKAAGVKYIYGILRGEMNIAGKEELFITKRG